MFADGFFAYRGPAGATAMHAHHAVQLVICLGADEVVLRDGAGREATARAFVIPANTRHAIVTERAQACLLYVEPRSDAGHALTTLVRGEGVRAWRDAGRCVQRAPVPARLDAATLASRLLRPYQLRRASPALHPRLQAALDVLPSLVAGGEVRASRVAERAGLSDSRLMHLFRAQLGIPLRPYVRWLRLRLAADQLRCGRNLTAAAHAAGFADGAHFSNAFRATFGLSPSAALQSLARR